MRQTPRRAAKSRRSRLQTWTVASSANGTVPVRSLDAKAPARRPSPAAATRARNSQPFLHPARQTRLYSCNGGHVLPRTCLSLHGFVRPGAVVLHRVVIQRAPDQKLFSQVVDENSIE